MSLKRYNGSAWVDVESVKRYNGSAWVDCESVKRYTGSAWVEVWSNGILLSELEVGSKLKTAVNGVDYNWLVVHQGLPSSLYDASCNGTWLLLEEVYQNRLWDTSDVPYGESDIHTYLNGAFFGYLPPAVQSLVKQVKIPCQAAFGSETINSGANGLSTRLFLLSPNELGVTDSTVTQYADGAKLSYFLSGATSEALALRIASLSGTAAGWWTRTTRYDDVEQVISIGEAGNTVGRSPRTGYEYGTRPAMILPSTAKVEAEPNPDGSYNLKV